MTRALLPLGRSWGVRRPLLPLPLLVVLVAGCVAPAAAPEGSEAATAPAADPGTFAFPDCRQVHSYFPSPAQPFQAFVPEGFAMVTDDAAGATVSVRVEATVCAEASEVWVEIPVAPPAELEVEDATSTAPVVAYVSPAAHAERYLARLPDQVFEATIAFEAASAGRYSLTVTTPAESYAWEGVLDAGGNEMPAWALARWAPVEGGVAGHWLRAQEPSMGVGLGATSMLYTGSGGAPPVANGIVHVVEGLALSSRFVEASA